MVELVVQLVVMEEQEVEQVQVEEVPVVVEVILEATVS